MFKAKTRAQSTIEYAMLIGLVAIAFSVMFFYAKRTVDGKFKMLEKMVNISQE